NNPLLMEDLVDTRFQPARQAMGQTMTYAKKMNLTAMKPNGALASSGYALANPIAIGAEYIVMTVPPKGNSPVSVNVDLSASPGNFSVEWLNTTTGTTMAGKNIRGGKTARLDSPWKGTAAIVYLKEQ